MQYPIRIDEDEILITVSIGVAICPKDSSDAELLISNADLAMYRAKIDGRDRFQYFEVSMKEDITNRSKLEHRIRNGIKNNQFKYFYQPIINSKDGTIDGVEALLRWQSSDGRYLPPNEFIEVAEETGLIVPLGLSMFKDACIQVNKWHNSGFNWLFLSINISPRQWAHPRIRSKRRRDFERNSI